MLKITLYKDVTDAHGQTEKVQVNEPKIVTGPDVQLTGLLQGERYYLKVQPISVKRKTIEFQSCGEDITIRLVD